MSQEANPLFSVIIPLYNKEADILSTVNSVLDQSYTDFELIVVNDGSTDNSLNTVRTIQDSRVIILNQPNGGVSSARNRGIDIAKGSYVALLDGDDTWSSGYLQEVCNLIKEFDSCPIFGINYSIRFMNEEKYTVNNIKHYIVPNYFESAMYLPLLTSSSVVIKRTCLQNGIRFNENFTHGEDLDVWIKLYKKYKKIGYSTRALALYNHDASNRACRSLPSPKKHFAFFFNVKEAEEPKERKYYMNQISILVWLYLKNLQCKNLLAVLFKYKRYTAEILYYLFLTIFFNRYKKAIQSK